MKRVSARRDAWIQLFPMDEAQRATAFLVQAWQTATTGGAAQDFAYRLNEAKITEKFWWFLDQLSVGAGRLTGQWNYEKPRIEFDPATGKKIKRIRQDIEYFSNAGSYRLSLTYEFKKVRASGDSWRTYQGISGMRRFVDGYYAKQQPVAVMVAMTMEETARCIDSLRRSLSVAGVRSELQMLPDPAGRYLREPSFFPGRAAFDTEHKRPADQAPPHGTTLLAHVFLSLPEDKDSSGV